MSGGTRGRSQGALLRLRGEVPIGLRAGLGVAGLATLLGVWALMATRSPLVPTPLEAWDALVAQWRNGELWDDTVVSCQRVFIGYAISLAVGVVAGVLIGSFRSAEAFFEAPIGFLRYIPASALTPLFLLWLGIDEPPKIALIVVGSVFFNILMVADVARAVPIEEVQAAWTLGAGRATIVRRVVLPHSYPGIIDVARINLAAAWLMLVIAEVLAANQGLAYRVVRQQRNRAVDTMFALLFVLGVIGMLSDLFLRWLRRRTAAWAS